MELGIKYIDRELPNDEKEAFLLSINGNETLRQELVECHHLFAYLSLYSGCENKKNTEKKLLQLLEIVEKKDR